MSSSENENYAVGGPLPPPARDFKQELRWMWYREWVYYPPDKLHPIPKLEEVWTRQPEEEE